MAKASVTPKPSTRSTLSAPLQALLDKSLDGVVLSDKDQHYMYASPSVERVLGYPLKSYLEMHFTDYLHPEDLAKHRSEIEHMRATPGATISNVCRAKHKNGTWKWLEITATNLLEDPNIQAVVSNFRDITDQKEAQAALQQSEERFRTLLEQSADAVQLIDQHGHILFTSDSVQRVLGYPAAAVVGQSIFTIIHPDDQERVRQRFNAFSQMPGQRVELEYQIQHADGHWVWLEATAVNHLDNPTIGGIVANFRTTTERKQAEERLKESEERYRLLVDYSPEAIAVHQEGKVVYANQAAAQMMAASSPAILIGRDILSIVHPEDHALVIDRVKRIYQEGLHTDLVEERFIRLDGTVIDVEAISIPFRYNGRPAVQVVVHDVTESRKAAAQLKDSEERLGLALRASHLGLWDWDVQSQTLIWSEQMQRHYGLAPGSFSNTFEEYQSLIHPDDQPEAQRVIQEAIATGEVYTMEHRVIWPDGSIHWLQGMGQAFFDASHQLTRMSGTVINIDERKELQLRKDEFLGVVSHELRTPVTSLKAYTQLLERRIKSAGDVETAKHLAKMDNQLNKLNALIGGLLDTTRIEAGQFQMQLYHFNLAEVVAQEVETAQLTTDQHTISLQSPPEVWLEADPDRIGQVVANFLANAIKYAPREPKIDVTLKLQNDQAILEVRDRGMGIIKDEQPLVFERFYRANATPGQTIPGLGLGLFISSEIIRRHHGQIGVKSQPGLGSTFFFRLPLKQ